MIRYKFTYLALAASLLFAGNERLHAQTIGYAEALGELAVSCGKDIAKFCGRTNESRRGCGCRLPGTACRERVAVGQPQPRQARY